MILQPLPLSPRKGFARHVGWEAPGVLLYSMVKLMEICGNYAPMQYEAMKLGVEIRDDWKARRLAEIEAERAELMRAA